MAGMENARGLFHLHCFFGLWLESAYAGLTSAPCYLPFIFVLTCLAMPDLVQDF